MELTTPFADTFRMLNGMYTIVSVFLLLGSALLARLLARDGQEQLALLAFTLILVTGITGVFHGAFHVGLTTWAAEEAGRTGSIPEIYQPLRDWADGVFHLGYVGNFVAMALIGWAILRSGLLAPTLGWTTIDWSFLCLVGLLVGVGAPAVVGIALLRLLRR